MSIASAAAKLIRLAAVFDPELKPLADAAAPVAADVDSDLPPLAAAVSALVAKHGGDHDKAAATVRAVNGMTQEQQNEWMSKAGAAGV